MQFQNFPPISDDQSVKHIPKVENSGSKESKPSFFRKALHGTKILVGGVVGTFVLGTVYVVVSEYMEDKMGSRDGAGDPHSLGFTSQKNGNDEYPTIKWPLYSENVDKSKIKPKLVVLGSGWGAIGLLKNLEKEKYDILVVSPSNYFLFTPLLPSVTVGTLEPRSLLEPIRRILRRFGPGGANFFQASAVDVNIQEKKVLLEGMDGSLFYVPYDQLVVAVGSKTNTMGVKGLEHANFLRTIQDARKIRAKIFDLLESASLPTVSPERRREMLSFVVCGGGPTGNQFNIQRS
ncbi:hypothetical protein DSO57_1013177 [Entomophthora muscae]|uniref:Uncharacterized protein n=1 Tax=Entomophthora muscae TaxID=34485 RepID=A0ACC2URN4_9FUNG|nr:hypothetical protein DSO57_1013177 [Entomophthora muscae]